MSYRELEEYALKQSEEMRYKNCRTARKDIPANEPDAPTAAEPAASVTTAESPEAAFRTEQQAAPETEVVDIPGDLDDWDYFPIENEAPPEAQEPEYEIPPDAIPRDEEASPAPQASQEALDFALSARIETIPAVQKPPEKAPQNPRRAPTAIKSKAPTASILDPSEVNGVSLGAAQSTT